ncbi:MAG: zinc ribbon domain-containing protein [Sedimentisphaerales bacterium]|nr:zinc ribbon domain-containing protein [Sedimentisphaerales bacterium]
MSRKDYNFSDEDFEEADSEADTLAPDATPLCPNCLKPVDPKQYYCPHCGSNEAINPLATYMPLVRIRHNYDIFITMWRTLWRKRIGSTTIILFSFLIAVFASSLLLIGLPVMLWLILRDNHLQTYRLRVFGLILLVMLTTFLLLGRSSIGPLMGYRVTVHNVTPK